MGEGREVLSLVRDPRIRLYWSGQFLSAVGSSVWGIALPLLALRETGSSLSVAFALLVSIIPEALTGPWVGALADKYSKLTAVVFLDVGRALLYFIAAFTDSLARGWLSVSLLLVVAFLEALLRMWCIGAKAGLLKAFESEGYDLQKLYALDRGLQLTARIVGWIAGGLVVSGLGTVAALLLNGLSFALAAAMSALARLPLGTSSQQQEATQWQLAVEGFRYLKRTPEALRPIAMMATLNLLIPAYAFGLPILAQEFWGGARDLGLAFAAFAGGGVIASIVLGKGKSRRFQDSLIWGAIAIAGGLTVAVANVPSAIGIFLVATVGLISDTVAILVNARVLEVTDGAYVGRVSVLSSVANRVTSSLVILSLGITIPPAEIRHAMSGLGMSIGVLSLIAMTRATLIARSCSYR